jgi:hypothetical protein
MNAAKGGLRLRFHWWNDALQFVHQIIDITNSCQNIS